MPPTRARRFPSAACAFFAQSAEEAEASGLALTPADFAAVNPNTGTAPVFRSRRDAEITLDIYQRVPVLVDRRSTPPARVWPVRYATMFHMTNDSDKFRTEAELVAAGAYRVVPNRWKKGAEEWVPLYEGKMVQAFDHRAASVVVNPENLNRPAQPEPATDDQHADPNWLPNPQFWIQAALTLEIRQPWTIGLKHVSSATNARTVICAIVPRAGYGNSLPVLDCENGDQSFKRWAPLLLPNLNSFALDFIARQKIHGNNLNLYVIEQLPILPLDAYAKNIGATTAEAIVRDHVLRLSYTAHDLAPFAEDQGYAGPPFRWDPEERLHLRARLDALFFLLYGLDRDATDYILGTFPIVREEEMARYGRFRSRELVLGYMAAFGAGHADSRIAA